MDFWKDKKVFVTGGQRGFIGSHLVSQLQAEGAEVETCAIDLLSEELSDKGYSSPEYIFHLAAISPSATDAVNPEKIINDNVAMTQNVLRFAHKSGAKLVFVSSSHVYPRTELAASHPWKENEAVEGQAFSAFGVSKQHAEKTCLDFARENVLVVAIVRLSNVYGPGDSSNRFLPSFIRKCLQNSKLEVFGSKDTVRDFVYIDDAVGGLLLAGSMLGYGEVLNIGSGTSVTVEEIAEQVKQATGRGQENLVFTPADAKPEFNVLNIIKAQETLRYAPAVTLAEGIRRTVEWWQARGIN